MFNKDTKDTEKDQQADTLSMLINNFNDKHSAESYSSLAKFSSDFQKLDQTSMEAILKAVNGVLAEDNKNSYAWLVLGKLVPQQNEALPATEYQNRQQQFVNLYNKTLSEDIRKQLSSHLEGLNIYCYGKAIENDDKNYFAWDSLGDEFSQYKGVLKKTPENILQALGKDNVLTNFDIAAFCYAQAIAQTKLLDLYSKNIKSPQDFFTKEIDRHMKSYIKKCNISGEKSKDLENFEANLLTLLKYANTLDIKLDVKKDEILNDIRKISNVFLKKKLLESALDQETVLGKYFYLRRGLIEPSVESGTLKIITDELKKPVTKSQFFPPEKKDKKEEEKEEKEEKEEAEEHEMR